MGEFSFRVPVDWNLGPYHANSIHVVGLDGIPWPCRISVTNDPVEPKTRKLLVISRNRDESGRLYVVFPFERRGEMLTCTGTLPVRDQPYELLTELARGTLNRLRNQISIWSEGGLSIGDSIHYQVGSATTLLSESILCEDSAHRDEVARQSIEKSMDAIFELSDSFGDQISKFRREHDEMSKFWLAAVVGRGEQFQASLENPTFDLFQVDLSPDCPTQASRLSGGHAEDFGKRVIVGPWLDASLGGMSQRLINMDDYLSRKDHVVIECRRQLERLPSTTSLIHVASGLNGIGHRHLSYPQQLQVTVDMLRAVEESRVELPTMVSFDYPWAERLAGAVGGVHPLQIADSLLRQGLPISFLGLDISLDYWPNGCAVRDPLQWIDLVDVWAQLGLPLILCFRAPTGADSNTIDAKDGHPINQSRSNLTDQMRVDFLSTVLPMMVARPTVHGLIWRQWQDQDDPRFPCGGFRDERGGEKPISQALEKIRFAIDGEA